MEKIEKVERYLLNQMSGDERINFQTELENDENLRQLTDETAEVLEGIRRNVLCVKIKAAGKHFYYMKTVKMFLIGLTITSIVAWVIYFYSNTNHKEAVTSEVQIPAIKQNISETSEIKKDTATTTSSIYEIEEVSSAISLPEQKFLINNQKDTVIETKGGIVIYVPEKAFGGQSNIAISGNAELIVQEALSPFDIISAGLNTRSGDKLLETAGMFYLKAKNNGNNLSFIKPLTVKVPAEENLKFGMKLFEGEQKKDGSIDWIKPQALQNNLVPVDMLSLDFFPSMYLSTLHSELQHAPGKKFADSLYYSFAKDKSAKTDWINPLSIKAIWDRKFNNTILSTKEFEARVKVLHSHCSTDNYFDLYIQNLDKNLWEIDKMVEEKSSGKLHLDFKKFREELNGRVEIENPETEKLSAYFELKRKASMQAIENVYQAYLKKVESVNMQTNVTERKIAEADLKRNIKNLLDETEINKRKVFKEFGINSDVSLVASASETFTYYTASVANPGWHNIDRQVEFATKERKSQTFSQNGKTSKIMYTQLEVELPDEKYTELQCFLIPQGLYSFMKMKRENENYMEKLNADLDYDLVYLGWKESKMYWFTKKKVRDNNLSDIRLKETTQAEMRQFLSAYAKQPQLDFEKEIEWQHQLSNLKDQQEKFRLEKQKIRRIKEHVFPCIRENNILDELPNFDEEIYPSSKPPGGLKFKSKGKKFGF